MKTFVRIGVIVLAFLVALGLVLTLSGGLKFKKTPSASVKLGKSHTTTQLSSSSTSSSTDHSAFNSRRLMLVSGSQHPLAQRVCTNLLEELKKIPQIEEVETPATAKNLGQGAMAPDLFAWLDLIALEEDGVLSHSTKARFMVFFGTAPWQSSRFSRGRNTPPLIQYTWDGNLEAETTFSGMQTDRYGDAALTIAQRFSESISNEVNKLSTQFGPLTELPHEFYGPYRPVTDFEFLKKLNAERVASFHGLMTHNETFWRFRTASHPESQAGEIIAQLEAAGWKLESSRDTNTEDFYNRFVQPGRMLELFRIRHDGSSVVLPANQPMEVVAHYSEPFSTEETEAAVERLFSPQPAMELLLRFQDCFSASQRSKFNALLEKAPVASPKVCLQLAELQLGRKQTNAAIELLRRAKALVDVSARETSSEAEIKSLAKKISPGQELNLEVTPEICRALGFIEITNAPQVTNLERSFDQPVLLFGDGERGLHTFSLTINSPRKGISPWSVVHAREGGRSKASSAVNLTNGGRWEYTLTFDKRSVKASAIPLPGNKRMQFRIEGEQGSPSASKPQP